jgi:hypothetical protein
MSRSKKNWDYLVDYQGKYIETLGAGLKGEKGKKGDKGHKGEKGLKGKKGDEGAKGDQGIKGDRGFRGFKGNTGTPAPVFDFQGVVTDLQELQTKPTVLSHVWMVGYDGNSSNSLWTYSGIANIWVKMTDTTTALKGDQGAAGINGEDGEDGIKGEEGIKGEKGEEGEKGGKGEEGVDGADGVLSLFTLYPELPTNQLP